MFYFVSYRDPVSYHPLRKSLSFCDIFITCHLYQIEHISFCNKIWHSPAFVLHPNASVCLQSKMYKFSNYSQFSVPPSHIPPLCTRCHSNKSPQGGLRQSAVAHVTTGAQSEHSRQHDASTLEIYTGGIYCGVFHLRQCRACSDVCFALVNRNGLQRGTWADAVYCQCNDKQHEQTIKDIYLKNLFSI